MKGLVDCDKRIPIPDSLSLLVQYNSHSLHPAVYRIAMADLQKQKQKPPEKNRIRDWAGHAASVTKFVTSQVSSDRSLQPMKVVKTPNFNSKTFIGCLTCVLDTFSRLLIVDIVIESSVDPSAANDQCASNRPLSRPDHPRLTLMQQISTHCQDHRPGARE